MASISKHHRGRLSVWYWKSISLKKIYSCCTVECVQSILKLGKINTCILSVSWISSLRCWRLVGHSDRLWPHWEFSAWGFYCIFYKTAIRKRLSRFPMASAALQTNHFRCKQKCYANGVSFREYGLLMLVSSQPTWFQSEPLESAQHKLNRSMLIEPCKWRERLCYF